MQRSQLLFAVIVLVVGGFLLANNQSSTGNKAIKVGVTQNTSHAVFDDIKKGIITGFDKAGYKEGQNVAFDFQNAQGEASAMQSIAQKFSNSNYDLYMPLGTPASQGLVNVIKEKPIVFGAVTDPVSAGLVKSNEKPGSNVTGTSDITLYREHLQLLKQLKNDVKNVGVVYDPGEANAKYALEQTQARSKELGFEIITAPANASGEVLAAAQSLASRVDAFYMLPDNTVLAAQEAIIRAARESKKPLIPIDQSGVEKGGLATLGTNYEKVGERTAEVAIRVIKGEKPGEIPVLGVTDADLFINIKTADEIGLKFSDDLIKQAKQVYR